ncbi:hypothetical protein C2869_12500 [Saccharobesus litoralis]|uniref:Lcl C-terminal domain-containing protein n=1 Tax=Saccharobesus litoralis TaxID=2172099 RepID=A0A2S0VSL3_9ALTE|nr:DUF1566 domain-containing protein [Saccharobesus litoralis]AWB67205.1 hypothetical protein C2869_12500 [Saccharobesus litoralis]
MSCLRLFIIDFRRLAIVGWVAILSACGGSLSGEGTTDEENTALRVIVGNDLTVAELSEITITSFVNGDNEPYTYLWQVQPAQYADTISRDDAAELTFTAPDVTVTESVTLFLAVTDAVGNVATASKKITVEPISSPPIVALTQAQTGQKKFSVESGIGFSLSANWIDAEDQTAVSVARLRLEQISGSPIDNVPAGGIRRDFIASNLTPTVTELIANNEFINLSTQTVTLRFTLEVTDTSTITVTDQVEVDILPAVVSLPNVSAGSDIVTYEGQTVTLNGTANTSNLQWRQAAGTVPVAIINNTSPVARFTAPAVSEDTQFQFTLRATNSNGFRDDTVGVLVRPISTFDGFNDTGINTCASATSNLTPLPSPPATPSCASLSYPGQDAEVGRDPTSLSQSIAKRGSGELGFDFTKLDANGDEINNGTHTCIRDNVTELIWEVKTTTGYRSYNSTFSWRNTDTATSGNSEGLANGGSCTTEVGVLTSCDTEAYVTAINTVGLCGANDWRLPTMQELTSIFNFGRLGDRFARDVDGSELWPEHASDSVLYWTSQPSAFGIGTTDTAPNAWMIDSVTGNDFARLKSTPGRIILVRGAPESAE